MKSQGKELTGFKNQSKRRGKNKKGSGSAYGSDNVSLHEHSMESNPKTKTQGFIQQSLPQAHDWCYESLRNSVVILHTRLDQETYSSDGEPYRDRVEFLEQQLKFRSSEIQDFDYDK